MKDLFKNEVSKGDILMEFTGHWGKNNIIHLYEMPEMCDGHGYRYDIDGNKYIFAWVRVSSSIKIDLKLMPKGFEYSFKHGMDTIYCERDDLSIKETIESSNWKERQITKKDVDNFKKLKDIKITNIDDVRRNLKQIRKGKYMPNELIQATIEAAGLRPHKVINGEIGMSGVYDSFIFSQIISKLK